MASILDRYGIKEVADVTFYELGDDGAPKYPVLFLDTLKVSTIEQTAETTEARGGKGNAALISWDYNKEINVTLEDALFSVRSLAIMFGDANGASEYNYAAGDATGLIMKTERFKGKSWTATFTGPDGKVYEKYNPRFFRLDGAEVKQADLTDGFDYFCTYDVKVEGMVIDISANAFPGTYYITGDTFARNENSGKDEFFQFIIPKAKVTSENTITLEAEGDPSVFNMSLKVLRPADGVMMKLVKYNLIDGDDNAATASTLYHNHNLDDGKVTSISGPGVVTVSEDKYQLACEGATSWTSSDSNVAEVTTNGEVTAKAEGAVIITATDADDNVYYHTLIVKAAKA